MKYTNHMKGESMLENKKTKAQGIYYSRYIASWAEACGQAYFGDKFEEWLRSEECTEEEIHEIVDMAITGKYELELSAKMFIDWKCGIGMW